MLNQYVCISSYYVLFSCKIIIWKSQGAVTYFMSKYSPSGDIRGERAAILLSNTSFLFHLDGLPLGDE